MAVERAEAGLGVARVPVEPAYEVVGGRRVRRGDDQLEVAAQALQPGVAAQLGYSTQPGPGPGSRPSRRR